jgi:hypothetical protein
VTSIDTKPKRAYRLVLLLALSIPFLSPASPAGSADPDPNSGANGRPVFEGVRYPPKTSGAFYVDGFYRMILQASGVARDAHSLCEARREVPSLALEKLQQLLAPGDAALASKMSPDDVMQAHFMWALMESYEGHMDAAIAQWQIAYEIAQAKLPGSVAMMQEVLGTAYLHKAEMENGVYKHPDDRCLFPPRPGVPHARVALTANVDKAIQYFSQYLEKEPGDLEVKWLLNIAYFTAGKYPEGVPPKFLIAPSVFASKRDVGRFVDVAASAGLTAAPYRAGAIVVDDFDNDGLFDVVSAGYDICDRVHFFHNNGTGTFSDRSVAAGVSTVGGGLDILQADYNNDGCMDLLVPRGAWLTPMPVALLRNNCNGTFTDVTREAGLGGVLAASQTVAWADIDNDGWLDLFIGDEQGPAKLFRNRGNGTFEDISHAAGIDRTAFTKGVVADDYDHDGYPDFYVSNIRGNNWLYHNNRNGTFTEVSQAAGVHESFASFATWFFDYDNDGWPDIFASSDYASVDETLRTYLHLPRSNGTGTLKLYKNMKNGTFKDVTVAVGLDKVLMPMGANFGDVDDDGYLDIYLATGAPDFGGLAPKVLLHNDEARSFTDISASAGIGDMHKGHGSAFVDLENRGREDIVASMGGAVPGDAHALRLFRNPGNGNDWISVKLVGTKTNRAAIGARIKVTVDNKGSGVRSIYRTVSSGSSFGSSPLEQHIGLGPSATILEVEVSWPVSQTRQSFKEVASGQFIEIKELAPSFTRLERKQYRLGAVPRTASVAAPSLKASGPREPRS